MALSTSNVKATAVEAFFEGLAAVPDSWRSIVNFSDNDVAALRIASMTGAPDFSEWAGNTDLDTKSIDSPYSGTTLAATQYGYQVRINRLDVADIPNIVGDTVRKVGMSLASTYASLAYANLELGFTGGASAIPDGKGLFAGDHPTATGTRSNYGSSALDRSAFMAAVKSFRKWVNYQDQPQDLTPSGFYLVVPPELEQTAMEVIQSPYALSAPTSVGAPADTYTPASVQGEINVAGMFGTTIIVSPYLTDANDWFLITKAAGQSPLQFWERLAPRLATTVDEDSLQTKISADFAVATERGPEPTGAFGSEVS